MQAANGNLGIGFRWRSAQVCRLAACFINKRPAGEWIVRQRHRASGKLHGKDTLVSSRIHPQRLDDSQQTKSLLNPALHSPHVVLAGQEDVGKEAAGSVYDFACFKSTQTATPGNS